MLGLSNDSSFRLSTENRLFGADLIRRDTEHMKEPFAESDAIFAGGWATTSGDANRYLSDHLASSFEFPAG
jgi:hypothetical protein